MAFFDVWSCEDRLPDASSIVSAIRNYEYVLQHTLDEVAILDAKNYDALPDDLLELRAFNDDGELHIVDVCGEIRGRVRQDGGGKGAELVRAFDEEHMIWGSEIRDDDDTYLLVEDRGTRVRIPKRALPGLNNGNVITVRVRNYRSKDTVDPETGDTWFGFSDWRIVGFGLFDPKERD